MQKPLPNLCSHMESAVLFLFFFLPKPCITDFFGTYKKAGIPFCYRRISLYTLRTKVKWRKYLPPVSLAAHVQGMKDPVSVSTHPDRAFVCISNLPAVCSNHQDKPISPSPLVKLAHYENKIPNNNWYMVISEHCFC